MLLVKLWAYSYLIVMELAIMTVLIVFIESILELYDENHEDEKVAEEEQIRN